MNELFPITDSPLPRLTIARKRLAKAQEAYAEADESADGTTWEIRHELARAEQQCAFAEIEIVEAARLTAAAFRAE